MGEKQTDAKIYELSEYRQEATKTEELGYERHTQNPDSVLYDPEALEAAGFVVRDLTEEEMGVMKWWSRNEGGIFDDEVYEGGIPRRMKQYELGKRIDDPRDKDVVMKDITTIDDLSSYMEEKDIIANQIVCFNGRLIATEQAIADMENNHYRPSQTEIPSPKVACKTLLLTAEHIAKGEEATYDESYVVSLMKDVKRPRDIGKTYKKAMMKAGRRGEDVATIFKEMVWDNIHAAQGEPDQDIVA